MTEPLRMTTFQADITPPIGAALCYGYVQPAATVTDPLTCRGVVLMTQPQPTVLCAVDWLGIANEGYARWRDAIAQATGTTAQRVFLHCVHQHNATAYDPEAAALLGDVALSHDDAHAEAALQNVANAAREAMTRLRNVTHVTSGAAAVEKIASNRRILGPDGKVKSMRMSACKREDLRAEPVGLIDPLVRVVGLWDGDTPIARLSWYATHPQSYYNDGAVTWDFPGVARQTCEAKLPGATHLHFTGAAGNIAAGKYNDGSHENRPVLAQRLADGIERAWQHADARRSEIDATTFTFRCEPTVLPLTETLDWDERQATLHDKDATLLSHSQAARSLVWKQRCAQPIELSALHGAGISIVNLPGEPSIEYQLALQALRPNDTVCVAGYGEYGPSYICTEAQYAQGGYEAETSLTAPAVEGVLLGAFGKLMG